MKNSFNVSAKDAKFIVNEDKRMVICVIEQTAYCFRDFVHKNFRIPTDADYEWTSKNRGVGHYSVLDEQMIMPNKFVGISRCSEDDEWNEDIGKIIAFSRAKDNLLDSFYKRANKYVDYLVKSTDEAIDILNCMGEKLVVNKERRHKYIDSLVGEKPETEA